MSRCVIVDANVFIGRFFSRDQYFKKSFGILSEGYAKGDIRQIFTTDYVIVETLNFLLNHVNFIVAKKFLDYISNSEGLRVIYMGDVNFYRLRKFFEKYEDLSIVDCSLLLVAEDFGITEICSFDKGFDKIKSIKRLETVS